MKFIKKLTAIITGQSNPMQLFLAALFGFLLGFMPGFQYSPFIYLVAVLLLLLLNVNLVVAAIIFAVAEILSFVLEALSYHLGTWLLDGFLQPLRDMESGTRSRVDKVGVASFPARDVP